MQKRIVLVLALSLIWSAPAHALFGAGDVVYDPQSYGKMAEMFEEAKKMYENAKKQLDSLASMERTIKEAQQAYDSLASTDLKQVAASLQPDGSNAKTAAGLRAEMERLQSNAGASAGYLEYQKNRIKQLENLELLQKASASNVQDSSGKVNQATAEKITAQSSATLAALATAEEQRRVLDDAQKAAAAKAEGDMVKDSANVYAAIGQDGHGVHGRKK